MKRQTARCVFLIGLTSLSPALATRRIDLSELPSQVTAVVFFDYSVVNDSALFPPFQDQIIKAMGWEKELERLVFLTGIDLSKETSQLVLAKLAGEKGPAGTLGILHGNFSKKTRRAMKLSHELMRKRSFRVVHLGEGKVVFGSTEAVELYLATPEPLGPANLKTLQGLKSKSAVFGWMKKGWLAGHVPKTFVLDPEPEWSFIWARDQVSEQTFTASFGSSVRFTFTVSASDATASTVLQDELHDFFFSLTLGEKDEALNAALGNLDISQTTGQLSLDLELTEAVLGVFGRWNGFQGTLNWDVHSGRREGSQRVGEILAAAGIGPGDHVADVGAGGGFLAARLARVVGSQGRVWAVDIDSGAVERVRRRADSAPYPQLQAVQGKIDDPGLPKGELEAIFVVDAYHEMEEHEAMLEHMRNALKSGGRLVVVEPYNATCGSDPRSKQVQSHVLSPDLVESELRKHGFQIREREDDFVAMGVRRKQSLVVAVRP